MDAAVDKVKSLAKEPECVKEVDMVESAILRIVTEPKFQYGAEAFEAYQQTTKAEATVLSEVKGKSR